MSKPQKSTTPAESQFISSVLGGVFTVIDAVVPAPVHAGTVTLEAAPGEPWSAVPSQNKAVKDLIRAAVYRAVDEYLANK